MEDGIVVLKVGIKKRLECLIELTRKFLYLTKTVRMKSVTKKKQCEYDFGPRKYTGHL